MPNVERTGSRESDLIYSAFHREIADFCKMTNLDSVEWRSNRGIVAFIETAIRDYSQTLARQIDTKAFEATVLLELNERTKIPAYIVYHDINLTTFHIFKVVSNIESKMYLWKAGLTKNEYEQFIRSL